MPDGSEGVLARTIGSIHEIEADCWNSFANPSGQNFNPFTSYEFLAALEDSKSVSAEAGWSPMHLVLEDGGRIIGLTPLYAKAHSQGEYVFDHHWADAFERAGGRYYPKLLSAVPFTPVTGPRLLAKDEQAKSHLATAIRQVSDRMGLSSAHVNFLSHAEQKILAAEGFLPRIGEQYHWFNHNYNSFDDFLNALSSRKRKTIRRERNEANKTVTVKKLIGAEITEKYWDAFWVFYQDTGARKWGYPYLTRTFFRLIDEAMPERLLMFIAEEDGQPVAGALNFIGGDTLYGRYWGCIKQVPFLHYELCYYQAIEFAIERGLARVEAGAQGDHKISRGYEPVPTYSAHWISNDGFRDAIAEYLDAERHQTSNTIEALKHFTPFRK